MFEEYTFESGKYETWPTITKDTSVEELKFIHKKIWDYVVEHGEKPETPYFNRCTACEYVAISHGYATLYLPCMRCPIKWPGEVYCGVHHSLYDRWYKTRDKEHAIAIRDIEWRD